MTLLDAICDDALLGPAFAGPTWRPWHAFLRTIDGLPLSGQDLALYRQCTGRQRPPDQPAKEIYAIIGRRGGKSRLAAAIAVEAACLKDWTPHLAVGERATIALIAADRQQSRIVMEYVRGLLTSTPLLAQRIERETDIAIDLLGHVSIEVTTCSSRTTRGYSFCLVIGDEAAFWKSETSSEPDVEVLQAVRPGLSTLPGARLICISSPYSRRGVLWQAFKAHHGQDDDPVVVWMADSQTMNPALDPAVVAAAYDADPASAAAEYGAQFRTDVAAFVSREVLDACVVQGRQALPPCGDRYAYQAFVDPSGGSQDSFTMAIAHAEERDGQVVAVLDHVSERRPPFSPEEVVKEFAATLRQYRVHAVCGDRYGGAWPQERFLAHGIVYTPSERTRAEVYVECLPLLTSGRAVLLDHLRLLAQFLGLERRTSRVGRDGIDHAPGAHDDVANAAAGALVLAAQRGAGDAGLLVCEREPSDLLATMIHEFGPIEPYFRDPQVQARGLIVRMGNRDFIGSPIRMSRTPPGLRRGPAEIGEHSREVLIEAGFSAGEVEDLLASGALLQGAQA